MRRLGTAIIVALFASDPALAQESRTSELTVPSVETYFAEYRDKHKILMRDVDAQGGTFPERIARYEAGKKILEDDFRSRRKAEYDAAKQKVKTEHSCTSGSSGGVKDCGWKCAKAPSADAYTKAEWVAFTGPDKGRTVVAAQACVRMKVSGRGRNAGSVTAVFRFRPAAVTAGVERDVKELFDRIAQHQHN